MPRPRLGELPIWTNFVLYAEDVLDLAIGYLLAHRELPLREVELNRVLYRCVKRANKELVRDGRGLGSAPQFDSVNSPDENEESVHDYESKRPDIKWEILDPQADTYRNFDVECKRLGKPTRNRWAFNEKYFENGISRFISDEHSYGRMADVGVMVGYVQDAIPSEVLREVNQAISASGAFVPELTANNWVDSGVSKMSHSFDRPFPVSPFKLNHLWVDIRNRYDSEATDDPQVPEPRSAE